MKTKVGDAAIEVMHEYEIVRLAWGDVHALHEIYNRSGCKGRGWTPIQRLRHVLDALDRDERFEKQYFRGHTGGVNGSTPSRRLRMFVIKA
jgi:hypothetical protein